MLVVVLVCLDPSSSHANASRDSLRSIVTPEAHPRQLSFDTMPLLSCARSLAEKTVNGQTDIPKESLYLCKQEIEEMLMKLESKERLPITSLSYDTYRFLNLPLKRTWDPIKNASFAICMDDFCASCDSTNSTNPGNSTNPTNSTIPTNPTNSTRPANLANSTKPDEPSSNSTDFKNRVPNQKRREEQEMSSTEAKDKPSNQTKPQDPICRYCNPRNQTWIEAHCRKRARGESRALYILALILVSSIPITLILANCRRIRRRLSRTRHARQSARQTGPTFPPYLDGIDDATSCYSAQNSDLRCGSTYNDYIPSTVPGYGALRPEDVELHEIVRKRDTKGPNSLNIQCRTSSRIQSSGVGESSANRYVLTCRIRST